VSKCVSSPEPGEKPELVHFNGHLVAREGAMVSPFDYGFLYGYGLFETMRAYDGTIFRLEEHIARLIRGASILGFDACLSARSLAEACGETLRANCLKDARIRLTVTPGNGDGMPDPNKSWYPTVMATARKYVPLAAEKLERGFSAIIAQGKRCQSSPIAGMKSLCYIENLLARFDAQRKGTDEALFMFENGYLAEGSISNVFLVTGDTVATPKLEGVLPGIARDEVITLARACGVPVEERNVALDELSDADEAFLTNSVIEVMPVTSVDGKPVGTGKPGRITAQIASEYRASVVRATAQARFIL